MQQLLFTFLLCFSCSIFGQSLDNQVKRFLLKDSLDFPIKPKGSQEMQFSRVFWSIAENAVTDNEKIETHEVITRSGSTLSSFSIEMEEVETGQWMFFVDHPNNLVTDPDCPDCQPQLGMVYSWVGIQISELTFLSKQGKRFGAAGSKTEALNAVIRMVLTLNLYKQTMLHDVEVFGTFLGYGPDPQNWPFPHTLFQNEQELGKPMSQIVDYDKLSTKTTLDSRHLNSVRDWLKGHLLYCHCF